MDELFDQASREDLELALDCMYDSNLFDLNVLNEVVIRVALDSSLQDQLSWLVHCDWDLTHAKLTYKPGSIIKGWSP